jgi:hypothetical protein
LRFWGAIVRAGIFGETTMTASTARRHALKCYLTALTMGLYEYACDGVMCVYRPDRNAVLVTWKGGYRVVDVPKAWASFL